MAFMGMQDLVLNGLTPEDIMTFIKNKCNIYEYYYYEKNKFLKMFDTGIPIANLGLSRTSRRVMAVILIKITFMAVVASKWGRAFASSLQEHPDESSYLYFILFQRFYLLFHCIGMFVLLNHWNISKPDLYKYRVGYK